MVGRCIRACFALAAVAGVLFGSGCADRGPTPTSEQKPSVLPSRVIDFKMTAADLLEELNRDPKAVAEKYRGAIVEVAGTITAVGCYFERTPGERSWRKLILDSRAGGEGLWVKVNQADRHSVRFYAGQKIRLSLMTNPSQFNKSMWEFDQGEVIELGPWSSTPVTAEGLGELASKFVTDPTRKNYPRNLDVTGVITELIRYGGSGNHVESISLKTIDGWKMTGRANGFNSDPAIDGWTVSATVTIAGTIGIDSAKKTITIDRFELVTK